MIYFVDTTDVYNEAMKELSLREILALDTETTGLDPHTCNLLLIQLGNESNQYVFDYQALLRAGTDMTGLRTILESPRVAKILHNAKFDYKIIKKHMGLALENIACTFILEHILKKGIRQKGFSLADLALRYLNIELDKGMRQTFPDHDLTTGFTAEQIEYSALDVKYLINIFQQQMVLIRRFNMQDLARLECEAVAPTGDMELNGVFVNRSKWLNLYVDSSLARSQAQSELLKEFAPFFPAYQAQTRQEKIQKSIGQLRKKAEKATKNDQLALFLEVKAQENIEKIAEKSIGPSDSFAININSTEQMRALLSLYLGKEVESTVEEQLKKIDNPIIEKVIAYRKASKLCTTYGEEFLRKAVHPKTGRIHTNFNQVRADSGRYSSSDPVNLQNIPNQSKYREAFCVQDPTWKMISTDFSGAELRIMAEVSEDPAWIDAFHKNLDMHSFIASMLFKIPYTDIVDKNNKVRDEYKAFRTKAKTLVFGLIYGMGAIRLAPALKVSLNEAKALLNSFWEAFPSIETKLNELVKQAIQKGYAISPLDNRRRYIRTFDFDVNREKSHAANITKNMPFQGACASIMKKALVLIRREALNRGWGDDKFRLLMTIHDEAVIECHESIADAAYEMVDKTMVRAAEYYVKKVPMIADTQIGDHWIH